MPDDALTASDSKYAAVVVNIDASGLAQPFTYTVPSGLDVAVGDAVVAPFGTVAEQIGYVVDIDIAPPDDLPIAKIKGITSRIDGAAAFSGELWNLARWVADQTLCELRDVVKLIAPDPSSARIRTVVTLAEDWRDRLEGLRTAGSLTLIEKLESAPDGRLEQPLLIRGIDKPQPALAMLRKRGIAIVTRSVAPPEVKTKTMRLLRLCVDSEVALAEAQRLDSGRTSRQAKLLRDLVETARSQGPVPTAGGILKAAAGTAAKALAEKGLVQYHEVTVRRDPFGLRLARSSPPAMTDEQAFACRQIGKAIDGHSQRPFLLHGITGSGKTEVYLDAIAQVTARGKDSILLLPEIGLSAQVLDLLKARFGDEVAVLHSAISPGERFDEWQRIRRGEAHIVVGARSAVFAPVANLGLIVIDEEHDGAYKQDSTPRYHAREVALYRARQLNATVILGSATPAVESYFRAKIGIYDLLTLTKRVSERPLPTVKIVDLRAGLVRSHAPAPAPAADPSLAALGLDTVFGEDLLAAIGERLSRHEQAIIFLNRRGFSPFLLCRDCGFAHRCGSCDVTLTYHRGLRVLQCHHCNYRRAAPEACPRCGGTKLLPQGVGTEKVEQALQLAFPTARTLRMDRDTTERKGSHAAILRSFRTGGADILIGTQMVSKGLDFPRVTLVGVVSADTALNMPDYHAAEATFQLLTQVSGRAGRGENPGEVLVQTFDPDNETIRLAAAQNYEGFYFHEIGQRRDLCYPPFARLANIVVADEVEQRAIDRSARLSEYLRAAITEMSEDYEAQILGPVSCPLGRLRNRYRWHVMVRCATKPALLSIVRKALAALPHSDLLSLTVDIDPTTML